MQQESTIEYPHLRIIRIFLIGLRMTVVESGNAKILDQLDNIISEIDCRIELIKNPTTNIVAKSFKWILIFTTVIMPWAIGIKEIFN